MCCNSLSKGWKSFYNTVVYMIKTILVIIPLKKVCLADSQTDWLAGQQTD